MSFKRYLKKKKKKQVVRGKILTWAGGSFHILVYYGYNIMAFS